MSAKLTVVLFILICFEIGGLLIVLPWHRSWQENSLLYYVTDVLQAPWLSAAIVSGYFRGFVTGIGAVNILIGVWEIVNFRATVRAFAGGGAPLSHQ
jgi:hypothetical protein